MNKRSYLKEKKAAKQREEMQVGIDGEELSYSKGFRTSALRSRLVLALLVALPLLLAGFVVKGIRHSGDFVAQDIPFANAPIAAASGKKDVISIPTGTVKANPFLPYKDIGTQNVVTDVPQFELLEPPESVNEVSDAARLMDTIVSGILYDKYSPSAILNIEGNDYLVKKGDVVNNYKVLNIQQDSVVVKLGNNTYKAGIGEILTEGSVNHNDVSNLKNKFGGEKR